MRIIRQIGRLDPCFGWDGDAGLFDGSEKVPGPSGRLRGAYATVQLTGHGVRVVRDPLGINKLFWVVADEALYIAARPDALVAAGCSFADIRAIPPGVVIEIDLTRDLVRAERLPVPDRPSAPCSSMEDIAGAIRCALRGYVTTLAHAYPDAAAYVCLSGGLDSTGAALLVREVFDDVTAVSFDVAREGGPESGDRKTARRLARDLGLKFLDVTPDADTLLDGLDVVLREAIDWRDFNVHAALVNFALARGIRDQLRERTASEAIVFTGDLVNEYLCDYHAESYRGRTYYALPRLSPANLQRVLVRGLETSHREVGPFQAYGLAVVQPYAAVVDHYLALPVSLLADPARKERLCRAVFGEAVPDYVYERPKTRAQVGDESVGRGVLALCVDEGIDSACLRRRFAELHDVEDQTALDAFMRGGRYRWAVPTC